MTHDFIDDFSAALEREGKPYVIMVGDPRKIDEVTRLMGVHIRYDFDHWPKPKDGKTAQHDALSALATAVREEDDCLIMNCDQVQAVLGALDTLGTLLADAGHEWSEGERAIYEQATAILGAKADPPEDE